MLGWLYDIFVAIVSFIMSLFGFDLKKRSVHFEDEVAGTKDVAVVTPVNKEVEKVEAPVVEAQ